MQGQTDELHSKKESSLMYANNYYYLCSAESDVIISVSEAKRRQFT